MPSHFIQLDKDNRGVATLTLNRPEKHNAFDDVMIAEFNAKLNVIEQDASIRLVILKANGKNFSAGADLDYMQRMVNCSEAENVKDALQLAELMRSLKNLNKPTIALIQGAVMGGGVGLVACCDMAITEESARFCLSEVKLGLIPAIIGPYVLAAIGERAARRYFLTAESFSATQAYQLGLVHEVTKVGGLDKTAEPIVESLLANDSIAVLVAKQFITELVNQKITPDLIHATAERIARLRVSPAAQARLKTVT